MNRLFVYIVDKPFAFRSVPIAGELPLDRLQRVFADTPHRVVTEEPPKETLTMAKYIAVIPSSMPLVTPAYLASVLADMEKRSIPALEIGRGMIAERAALLAGHTAKRKLRTAELRNVISREDFHFAEREIYMKNAQLSAQNGAIIPDVENVRIDSRSRVEAGATVMPYAFIQDSTVKSGAVIGSFSTIERSVIGEGATVLQSVVKDSEIGKKSTVGPFAYVRMGSLIGDGCRIGDFVEVKRSLIADGTKAAHLAYVGDAEVGIGTNVGCGTVFANYDGKEKHKTKVGNNVFIGANTNLVAPVTVGDDVYIAAATTVTRDVPEGSFVIGRSRAEIKRK